MNQQTMNKYISKRLNGGDVIDHNMIRGSIPINIRALVALWKTCNSVTERQPPPALTQWGTADAEIKTPPVAVQGFHRFLLF